MDMKYKIMMMGLAMVTGLPHAVSAKSGKEDLAQTYSSWNSRYMPHYGVEGAARPLMDHVSVADAGSSRGTGDAWRLEFAPPRAVSNADNPLTAKDTRMGFSLNLDF
jgi:hypothetical protein